jgi:vacuolar protein sorting-associated protein 1
MRNDELCPLCRDLIRPDIEEHKGRVRDEVKETLELEVTPIYTQNETDFENLRGRWLAKYGRARRNPEGYLICKVVETWGFPIHAIDSCEKPGPPVSPEQQALNYLAQAGYRGLTVDDLARLYPRDHFGEELTVMADVRACFTITYKVQDIEKKKIQ